MTEDKKVETFRGIKAFQLLSNGRLQTGGIAGSLETLFEEGKTYSVSDEKEIELCSHGFHFYKTNNACFGAGLFGENTVLHEIIAYGNVISDTGKCVAKTIKIGKKISPKLDGKWNSGNYNSGNSNSGDSNSGGYNSGDRNSGAYNSGNRNSGDQNSEDYNTGNWNSGDSNSGNWNSGDSNSGDYNIGDRNSGDRNSGNFNSGNGNSGHYNSGTRNSGNSNSGARNSGFRNSGYSNSGDFNSGYYNSGDRNSGHYNSGDSNSGNWNSGHSNSGSFNTEEAEFINIFNKPCELKIWKNIRKPKFLYFERRDSETYKEAFQRSWKNTTKEDKKLLEKLPNFDWEIFTKISGIVKPK